MFQDARAGFLHNTYKYEYTGHCDYPCDNSFNFSWKAHILLSSLYHLYTVYICHQLHHKGQIKIHKCGIQSEIADTVQPWRSSSYADEHSFHQICHLDMHLNSSRTSQPINISWKELVVKVSYC